jgi:hypothetical protein
MFTCFVFLLSAVYSIRLKFDVIYCDGGKVTPHPQII